MKPSEPFSIAETDKVAMVVEFIRRICENHYVPGQQAMLHPVRGSDTTVIDVLSRLYKALQLEVVYQIKGATATWNEGNVMNNSLYQVMTNNRTENSTSNSDNDENGSISSISPSNLSPSSSEDSCVFSVTTFMLCSVILRTITELCQGPSRENQNRFAGNVCILILILILSIYH